MGSWCHRASDQFELAAHWRSRNRHPACIHHHEPRIHLELLLITGMFFVSYCGFLPLCSRLFLMLTVSALMRAWLFLMLPPPPPPHPAPAYALLLHPAPQLFAPPPLPPPRSFAFANLVLLCCCCCLFVLAFDPSPPPAPPTNPKTQVCAAGFSFSCCFWTN